MTPRRLSLLAAGAALATAAAPARAAESVLATESSPTSVAAYAGTVAWSSLDPATGNFVLKRSVDGGPPTVVPVAQHEAVPFDIDLGTNRAGSVYAVYSRDYDIYRLNPRTGAEEKLRISSPTSRERDPSIQRGRIAFIRRGNGKDQIRIGDTTGTGTPTRLVLQKQAILSIELGLQHLAYVETPDVRSGIRRLHIRNLRTGRDRVVMETRVGGASASNMTRPTFTDDLRSFVWARTNIGAGTGNRIVRYDVATGRLRYATGSARYASTAWAGGTLGLAASTALDPGPGAAAGCQDAGVQYCKVLTTGPLRFTASKP